MHQGQRTLLPTRARLQESTHLRSGCTTQPTARHAITADVVGDGIAHSGTMMQSVLRVGRHVTSTRLALAHGDLLGGSRGIGAYCFTELTNRGGLTLYFLRRCPYKGDLKVSRCSVLKRVSDSLKVNPSASGTFSALLSSDFRSLRCTESKKQPKREPFDVWCEFCRSFPGTLAFIFGITTPFGTFGGCGYNCSGASKSVVGEYQDRRKSLISYGDSIIQYDSDCIATTIGGRQPQVGSIAECAWPVHFIWF
eukprot:231265-Rhodomonas_salina.2